MSNGIGEQLRSTRRHRHYVPLSLRTPPLPPYGFVAAGMLTQIGFMHFMQEDFGCINHHHDGGDYQHVPGGAKPGDAGGGAGRRLLYMKLVALASGVGCMSVLAIWG